jgi:hypothetical protein
MESPTAIVILYRKMGISNQQIESFVNFAANLSYGLEESTRLLSHYDSRSTNHWIFFHSTLLFLLPFPYTVSKANDD